MAKTMFDKIWDAHEVAEDLIYIDLHLVHEVTSPRPSRACAWPSGPLRGADKTLAAADHNVPMTAPRRPADRRRAQPEQVEKLEPTCDEFGIPVDSLGSDRQGIVHVIGPELGVTQPGMTIVSGDTHTSTHGAFGPPAFGIGTSEVEHVPPTQRLVQQGRRRCAHLRSASSAPASPRGPDPGHHRPPHHRGDAGLRGRDAARRSRRWRCRAG